MKLTKSQKKMLKSIPNEKTRLEQKLQFKLQNKFESEKAIVFGPYKDHKKVEFPDGTFVYVKKWSMLDEPKEASLETTKEYKKGFFYKGKVFDAIEEALEYSPISETTLQRIKEIHKNWIGLANMDFNIKGNEIISDEKAKEISLNNEYLQKVLSETHDVKFFRDLQNICVKCQNYEYATKFRQKVRDILVTLSTEKLIELAQNRTIELSEMMSAMSRKKDKTADIFPKPEGKRIDMDSFKQKAVVDLCEILKSQGNNFGSFNTLGFNVYFVKDCIKVPQHFAKILKEEIKSDESANNNPKQFTLEDMRNSFNSARDMTTYTENACPYVKEKFKTFEDYIDSLKNPS